MADPSRTFLFPILPLLAFSLPLCMLLLHGLHLSLRNKYTLNFSWAQLCLYQGSSDKYKL